MIRTTKNQKMKQLWWYLGSNIVTLSTHATFECRWARFLILSLGTDVTQINPKRKYFIVVITKNGKKQALIDFVLPGPHRPEALQCTLPLTTPSSEQRPARIVAHFPLCSATWGSTGLLTSYERHPEALLSGHRWRSFQYLAKERRGSWEWAKSTFTVELNCFDSTVFLFAVNVMMKRESRKQEKTRGRSNVFSLSNTRRHNILLNIKTSPEETMQSSKMWQLPEQLTQEFLNSVCFLLWVIGTLWQQRVLAKSKTKHICTLYAYIYM